MIKISDLTFHYPQGAFSLNIPELQVQKHEKVAVIGPSGTGKTTLLNLIAGIRTPQSGSVQIDETRVDQLHDSERRRFRISQVGFVFQDFELLDYLTVRDNILHPYRITDALQLTPEVRQRAEQLAEAMGIGDKLAERPGHLSQGEQQRTAICRALLPQPSLILADEATGNLDPDNKLRIHELLFQAVEEHETTLLAVTHDYELLAHIDRIVDFKEFRQNIG